MDVDLSDEQIQLREAARDFLLRECPMSRVRAAVEGRDADDDGLWTEMASLGWTGLVVPSDFGGAGLDWIDLSLVLHEAGRALLAAPLLSTSVAADAVARLGCASLRERILPDVSEGRSRAALALLERPGSGSLASMRTEASPDGAGWRLTGVKPFVRDAEQAAWILVPARTPTGARIFSVDVPGEGVEMVTHPYTDLTRKVSEVRLDGVRVDPDGVLGSDGEAGWTSLLDRARTAACAEMCGGAERVLEASVAFARTREQFGRPIGAFQAIQHKCADMLVRLESMKSATQYATWAVAREEPDAHLSACLAKAWCGPGYTRIAGDGIQIHGGLGFTWEQDLHLYYKRAVADELAFGDAALCREHAAAIAIDRSPPQPA